MLQHAYPFQTLPYRNLLDIAAIGERVEIAEGEEILRRGHVGEAYYLLEGLISSENQDFDSGSFIGIECLADGQHAIATCVAQAPSAALVFRNTALERLFHRNPRLGIRVLRNVVSYLADQA